MNTDTPVMLDPFVVSETSLVPTWKGALILGVVVLAVWWVARRK